MDAGPENSNGIAYSLEIACLRHEIQIQACQLLGTLFGTAGHCRSVAIVVRSSPNANGYGSRQFVAALSGILTTEPGSSVRRPLVQSPARDTYSQALTALLGAITMIIGGNAINAMADGGYFFGSEGGGDWAQALGQSGAVVNGRFNWDFLVPQPPPGNGIVDPAVLSVGAGRGV
jgi:hypothetical protein